SATSPTSPDAAPAASAAERRGQLKWWQDTVVYEAYPKSFLDTSGQGTGTIAGITEKLDYLASLGVGAIWLTPVFRSPMRDNGYDVADYFDIDPRFGTMADMERLIAEARTRNIRIVMDLVMNHTSSENAWFAESASSRENDKSDWYIWRDARPDGGAPTNWRGIFGGSAWTWSEARQQYYLHTFADFQPDLNWECPAMRAELFRVARFWLEKGVGGFRMDAITYIKKPELRDGAPDASDGLSDIHAATANTEGILDFLREFRREVLEGTDAFVVGEANGVEPKDLPLWVGDEGVFDMVFEFGHVKVPLGGTEIWYRPADWRLTDLKRALSASQEATAHNGWYPIYLENHDQPRSPDHFLPAAGDKRAAAKVLGCVLMTLRGAPFLYQGEELGMTNVAWPSIDDYDDVSSRNQYEMALAAGLSEAEALACVHAYSRGNARTPMQWDASENAGFTTGVPWLPVHDDYASQNVEAEDGDPASVLSWYRSLARLRRDLPVLVAGDYRELLAESEEVYAFERTYGTERAVVLANFSEGGVSFDASLVEGLKVALGTHEAPKAGTLRPLEAVVYAG
ncbi:MAG: alpha-glucosidase, partial [Olsenella sp.]|nr:alpha-glucosidase [Olsenella sp.]